MTEVRSHEALLMAGALQNAIFARSLQSGRPGLVHQHHAVHDVSIRARSLQSGRLRAVKLLLRKLMDGISREPEWRQAMMTPQQDMRKTAVKLHDALRRARTCRPCDVERGSRVRQQVAPRSRWHGSAHIP